MTLSQLFDQIWGVTDSTFRYEIRSLRCFSRSITVSSGLGRLGLRVKLDFDSLLLPDLQLPVLRFLPRLLLVLRDRDRSLAMRRGSECVTNSWPEVEDRGMGNDL